MSVMILLCCVEKLLAENQFFVLTLYAILILKINFATLD